MQKKKLNRMSLKTKIKKIVPESIVLFYHRILAIKAALLFGFPAKKIFVIGVTGTKGKTSTANYVWSVLNAGGINAGLITSANFRFGNVEKINPYHMTMPSPYKIQKMLRRMKRSGVTHAVIEMTSEGMKQYRHLYIPVDIAIFTNLTPEHLTSHGGSFEEYKKAKSALFNALIHKPKWVHGKMLPRISIANADSEHAEYYLGFPSDQKISFGVEKGDMRASEIVENPHGASFTASSEKFSLVIPGKFNVYNAMPAIVVGRVLGITPDNIRKGLALLSVIPGRMEEILCGQPFRVFVDYAHEPASINAVLDAAQAMKQNAGKIILLTGGQGGGRDKSKRVPMAEAAAKKADYIIVANEDPYEDDPQEIIGEISSAVATFGKTLGSNLFTFTDRKEGIIKALTLAAVNDIVIIAGKGAEKTMMVKGGSIPWDERAIVKELTANYKTI